MMTAIDSARFQQNLLALIGEKENVENRAHELEERLAAITERAASAGEAQRRLEEERVAGQGKEREALDRIYALQKAQSDSEVRHAMRVKLLEDQAIAAKAKVRARPARPRAEGRAHALSGRIGVWAQMKEQEREIHSLEEQLRTRTNECSELVAYKGSTEKLIKTFAERLDEVGKPSCPWFAALGAGVAVVDLTVDRAPDLCHRWASPSRSCS